VLHVGRPRVDGPLPTGIESMMHAMERIEAYRDPCVREGRVPTQEIVDECDQALRECLALLNTRLSE
jgi:hypothetical protein